jgi:hypothetical protein
MTGLMGVGKFEEQEVAMETEVLAENPHQCHFVHQKSHTN